MPIHLLYAKENNFHEGIFLYKNDGRLLFVALAEIFLDSAQGVK
jgi:hypothetical protein